MGGKREDPSICPNNTFVLEKLESADTGMARWGMTGRTRAATPKGGIGMKFYVHWREKEKDREETRKKEREDVKPAINRENGVGHTRSYSSIVRGAWTFFSARATKTAYGENEMEGERERERE